MRAERKLRPHFFVPIERRDGKSAPPLPLKRILVQTYHVNMIFPDAVDVQVTPGEALPDEARLFGRPQGGRVPDVYKRQHSGTEGTTPTRTSSTRKYICPCCGNSVRATKEVNLACLDCNAPMVLEMCIRDRLIVIRSTR